MSAKLGPFELLEQLGKGGTAAVFRAYDPSLGREVALKLLDEDVAQQNSQFGESFVREAQIAASVNHPNIVEIYSVGQVEGLFYLVMELLVGRSLAEIIRDDGPLDEAAAVEIGIQISSALQAAYSNRMTHGNIKPQNIFITTDGTAKLLDIGLAKMASLETFAETDGGVWGSAYYIAPESMGRNNEDVGGDIDSMGAAAFHARLAALCKAGMLSDIYSLGATLFQALTGRPPLEADTPEALTHKRSSEIIPNLRRFNPHISAKTEQIVANMLNKSALQRYQSYAALIADLRAAESKWAGKKIKNAPQAVAVGTAGQGNYAKPSLDALNVKYLILAFGATVLILGGVIIFLLVHSKNSNPTGAPSPASTESANPSSTTTSPAASPTTSSAASTSSTPVNSPTPARVITRSWGDNVLEVFSLATLDSSETIADASYQSSRTSSSGLTRGPGLRVAQPASTDSLKSTASAGSYGATLDEAIAKNQYYEFKITPAPGWKITLKKLEFRAFFQNATGAGDRRGAGITYSTDGTNFSKGIVATGNTSPNASGKFTVTMPAEASLQNCNATVTLRIYLFGSAEGEFTGIGRAPDDHYPPADFDILLIGETQ